MKRTEFFTLTAHGAELVSGYFFDGFGYYKSGAQWRGIHGRTGLMVAQASTLRATREAVRALRPRVNAFVAQKGKDWSAKFDQARAEYYILKDNPSR